MTKYRIDPSEYAGLTKAAHLAKCRKIEKAVRAMGFRSFAPPELTDGIKRLVQVKLPDGEVRYLYELTDEELEEDYRYVPPASVADLSDPALHELMQFWHAVKSSHGKKLSDLSLAHVLATEEYETALTRARLSLKGQIDPDTGKKYTQKALLDAAEMTSEVQRAKDAKLEEYGKWKLAEAVYKSYKEIVESLNRQRMGREADAEGSYRANMNRSSRPIKRRRKR